MSTEKKTLGQIAWEAMWSGRGPAEMPISPPLDWEASHPACKAAYERVALAVAKEAVWRAVTPPYSRVEATTDGYVFHAPTAPPPTPELDPADIQVSTYTPPGSGGFFTRHDSGVRILHVPSGMMEDCHEERSQHANKARAFARLVARLNSINRKTPDDPRWMTTL